MWWGKSLGTIGLQQKWSLFLASDTILLRFACDVRCRANFLRSSSWLFVNANFPDVVGSAQKLYAGSSRRSDVPELLKKKHSKLQARSGGGGNDDDDDDDDEDDDDAMDTEDEVLTDTKDDEIIDLKPKNSNKRKSDDSSDGQAKKTKTEVFRFGFIYLLIVFMWCKV